MRRVSGLALHVLGLLSSGASAGQEAPEDVSSTCHASGSCPTSVAKKEDFLLQARLSSKRTETPPSLANISWVNGYDYDSEYDYDEIDGAVAASGNVVGLELIGEGAPGPVTDWMMETTLDNEWISGGDASDVTFHSLAGDEKASFVKVAHAVADSILTEGGQDAAEDRKIWVKKFQHEHLMAVRTLQRWPHLATVNEIPSTRYEGAGGISGLYTYGSPGTALAPLSNTLAKDGKFPGLRMVTQRLRRIFRTYFRTYHDPVPWFAGLVGMKHPNMDYLIIPVGYTPELHAASEDVSRRPRSDMAFWVNGHFQTTYYRELEPHKDKFDIKAWEMLHMSKAVQPDLNKNSSVGNARWASKVGWNLVAQSKAAKLGKVDVIVLDNTSLYQDPVSKSCALSFVGTHHLTQWLVNLRFRRGKFCGIRNVHMGFRNQVRRVITSKLWKEDVLTALASCPELYITGHSLGAAQAQLVAACMQKAPAEGEDGWEDYKHLIWRPPLAETVAALPPIVSQQAIDEFSAKEAADEAALEAAEQW